MHISNVARQNDFFFSRHYVCLSVPVDYAEMTVVGECFLIGSLPCDCGFGAATHFTPQSDTLPFITGHVTQWDEHLRGYWEKRNPCQPLIKTFITYNCLSLISVRFT